MSSTILRLASRQVARRGFATSAVVRRDLVQDIYVSAIKAYKPAVLAQDAHVGAVKAFALPPTPKAPAVPADLAAELSAYDAAEPAVDAPAATSTNAAEDAGQGAEAFLAFLEQDVVKPVHHH